MSIIHSQIRYASTNYPLLRQRALGLLHSTSFHKIRPLEDLGMPSSPWEKIQVGRQYWNVAYRGYHSVQNLLSARLLSKNLKIKIHWTIILSVILYRCETWSLTLWEERKLTVFENTVLRRIFGPRRDEVTGEGRRLHNEELNDLYCSPNIVRVIKWRRMRWVGHVVGMGEESWVV